MIHPSEAIVFLGPLHPTQVSWHGRQIPLAGYLASGHLFTQKRPSRTLAHAVQLSLFGPEHESRHSEWHLPHVLPSIWYSLKIVGIRFWKTRFLLIDSLTLTYCYNLPDKYLCSGNFYIADIEPAHRPNILLLYIGRNTRSRLLLEKRKFIKFGDFWRDKRWNLLQSVTFRLVFTWISCDFDRFISFQSIPSA